MRKLKVLVAGSTGRQGAAVAQWLLASGHDVVAMTRDLAHPAAMRLMRRGARLAWASYDDRAAVEEALQGCDGLFLTTSATEGVETETLHGTMMVDVASATGVRHVVYASVPAAAEPTGVPHFDSKHSIEKRLQQQRVPHTVVAPTWLMENFLLPRYLEQFREGRLALPYPAARKLQQVAVTDVARFVTLVFERCTEFVGERIALAGDALSGFEMAATFARAMNRSLTFEEVPLSAVWASDVELAGTFEYLARTDPVADVAGLRDRYDLDWHTLDGWARQQAWDSLLAAPGAQRRPS